MLHRRFILRQITRSPGQSVLLALGLALAVASLVALSGLSASVRGALNVDARRSSRQINHLQRAMFPRVIDV